MGDVPWISQSHHCPLHNLLTLALRELALASIVISPSSNNIEQEVLLLLADEYHPTCAISMTNPGSLNMGFAGADPRQLAPSVGTAQIGIAISAASSSASINTATPSTLIDSTTRADSDLFGSLGYMAHLPTFRPAFADLRPGINLTFGAYQIYINHWGTLH